MVREHKWYKSVKTNFNGNSVKEFILKGDYGMYVCVKFMFNLICGDGAVLFKVSSHVTL